MIQHPIARRHVQDQRTQVALEIILVLYSMAASVILVRTILILLGVTDRIWVGKFIYGITRPIVQFMASIPGFGQALIGPLTLVDLILLGLVMLFPLGLVAFSPRGGLR